ncbi:hypothetical protein MLD52_09115 [Puniceicoccaceae bacterium K14]|nr:hypothetical protein [Puniceicoccaceae bacterium K14]
MAKYTIGDLWDPEIWKQAMEELPHTFAHLMNSRAFTHDDELLDDLCNGPGVGVIMPFLKDITDQKDAAQREGVPIAKQGGGSGVAYAISLEREIANSSTAMAAQRSGTQPLDHVLKYLVLRRLKNRQETFLSMLRGMFDTALEDNVTTAFNEAGSNPSADQMIDEHKIIDTAALTGEIITETAGTSVWMHTLIRAALRKLDKDSFKTESTDGGLTIPTYKGMPIYASDKLARAGTTDGIVFDTYLLKDGVVRAGEKEQVVDKVDVASLQYDPDFSLNEESVNDRTRFAYHVDGMKYNGPVSSETPEDATLADGSNWSLEYGTAALVGALCIKTNG